jgi:hypothetical protein
MSEAEIDALIEALLNGTDITSEWEIKDQSVKNRSADDIIKLIQELESMKDPDGQKSFQCKRRWMDK